MVFTATENASGTFPALKRLLLQNRTAPFDGFGDFSGGYVGCLNFGFVEQCNILRQPLSHKDADGGTLYLVEKFCVYDNYTNRLYMALSKKIDGNIPAEAMYERIREELEASEKELKSLSGVRPMPLNPHVAPEYPERTVHEQGAEDQRYDRGRRGNTGCAQRLSGDR